MYFNLYSILIYTVELYYMITKIPVLFYKHSHITYSHFSFIPIYTLILAHSSFHVYSNFI